MKQLIVILSKLVIHRRFVSKLLYGLRQAGISADQDYSNRKLKGQFKHAERLGATYAIIVGEDELNEGVVNIKHLQTGVQETVSLNDITQYILAGKKGGN